MEAVFSVLVLILQLAGVLLSGAILFALGIILLIYFIVKDRRSEDDYEDF